MNAAKALKEQEVEECLNRERTEREPRYPLKTVKPHKIDPTEYYCPIDDIFEATGLKVHHHDRPCWCGTDHYDD